MFLTTLISFFFFFNDTATTEIYTLSLHDALPIYWILGMASGTHHGPGHSDYARHDLRRFLHAGNRLATGVGGDVDHCAGPARRRTRCGGGRDPERAARRPAPRHLRTARLAQAREPPP